MVLASIVDDVIGTTTSSRFRRVVPIRFGIFFPVCRQKMENTTLGKAFLAFACVLLAYYTVLLIGLPFLPDDPVQPLLQVRRFFPSASHALLAPCLVGTVVFVPLLLRAYYLVQQDRRLEQQSRPLKGR